VEFEYDQKNTLYVRIDRKRKFLGTIFLRALGLRSDEEILKTFYTVDRIHIVDGKLHWAVTQEAGKSTHLQGAKPAHAVLHNGDEIAHSGRKITAHTLKHCVRQRLKESRSKQAELDGALTASDIIDLNTGEVIVRSQRGADGRPPAQGAVERRRELRGLLSRARRRGQHHYQLL